MKRLPNSQQHAFGVLSPLVIPETQFFDSLRGEESLAPQVSLHLFRHSVLEAIQLDRELCGRTVKIQKVFTTRVLTPEFETGGISPEKSYATTAHFLRQGRSAGVSNHLNRT
jgi:hypothetical protein